MSALAAARGPEPSHRAGQSQEVSWEEIALRAPQMAATMASYLDQLEASGAYPVAPRAGRRRRRPGGLPLERSMYDWAGSKKPTINRGTGKCIRRGRGAGSRYVQGATPRPHSADHARRASDTGGGVGGIAYRVPSNVGMPLAPGRPLSPDQRSVFALDTALVLTLASAGARPDDSTGIGVAGDTGDQVAVPVASLRYVEAGESLVTALSSGSNKGGMRS